MSDGTSTASTGLSQVEPVPVSPVPASIPSAADFERWGLLKRNPAPDAAQSACSEGYIRMVIKSDGTVRPLHLCDHEGYSFARHGRCCPGCATILTDFGD